MSDKKKIAVIGSVNRDTVIHPNRPKITGFGGILYNIFSLSRLLHDRAEIVPVCNIGIDVSDQVFELLSITTNVSTESMRVVDSENNHCMMTYRNDCERDEVFTGFVPAISFRQLRDALDADLAIVNFISGRDVSLGALKRFWEHYEGTVYLDFHTLSLGLRQDGRRYLRKPKRWCEYIECCDFLQLNAREFTLLSGKPPVHEELVAFYKSHVSSSGKALLVTLGENGAAMVSEGESGPVAEFHRTDRRKEIVDTTGAGDIFTAAFCAGLVQDCPLQECFKSAVEASAIGCSFIHPQDFHIESL